MSPGKTMPVPLTVATRLLRSNSVSEERASRGSGQALSDRRGRRRRSSSTWQGDSYREALAAASEGVGIVTERTARTMAKAGF
jgi:hypothetical protein